MEKVNVLGKDYDLEEKDAILIKVLLKLLSSLEKLRRNI